MKTNPEAVRRLIEQSNAMIHTLMREPPCHNMQGNKSCIERETDADDGRQRKPPPGCSPGTRWGWNGYRQEHMCSACAALWAVSTARNHLDTQLRYELSIEAEENRKFGQAVTAMDALAEHKTVRS